MTWVLKFGTNVMIFRFPDKPIETSRAFLDTVDESKWIAQCKYDGWRLQIYKHNGKIDLLTRVGNQIDKKTAFPESLKREIDIILMNCPDNTVLDSEFVGPRGNHVPTIYLFDLLAYNGNWLCNVPFCDRWEKITSDHQLLYYACGVHNIKLAKTRDWGFAAMFDNLKADWIKNGNQMDLHEGIVLKRKAGTLVLNPQKSVDSQHMLKCKYRDIRGKRF